MYKINRPFPSCFKPLFQSQMIWMKMMLFSCKLHSLLFIVCLPKIVQMKKNKSNYLNSHGEEAQEEATGLIRNGLPQLNNKNKISS